MPASALQTFTLHLAAVSAFASCLLLSPLLIGHCVRLGSLLSPFVSLLVSLLVGHCVRLVSFVSRSPCPACLPSVSFCLPSCCAVPTLALQSFPCVSQLCLPLACNPSHLSPSSGLLCPAILYICLPELDCCVRLCLAILYICLLTFVSQLWLLCPQPFTFVLAILCICLPALDCCIRLCLAILYLSPSSTLHVSCKPLHLSPCVYICLPALECCGRLCLAILCLSALDVASSSCRVFRF